MRADLIVRKSHFFTTLMNVNFSFEDYRPDMEYFGRMMRFIYLYICHQLEKIQSK
jgi:hypothetical protein